MNLDISTWKNFRYDEIFILKKGTRLTKDDMVYGNIPFIGATEMNNGITAHVDTAIFPKNSISVSYNGSVAEAFYHEYVYWGSDDIHCLTLINQELDKYISMFLCTIIKIEKYRFNYGRKWNLDRMQESIIKLPMDIQGNPDWGYMRKFIKEIINQGSSKVKQALENKTQLEKPLASENTPILNTEEWKDFGYDEIFDITGSKTTPQDTLVNEYGEGENPYVTTQATNNGIGGFYDHYTEQGNVLTVDSAVLGYCSYQKYDFSASDHVEKLAPKFNMNKYHAIFLTTIINQEQYRFNYGRKASQTRLKQLSIKLPADTQGNPDWDYMENYIKTLCYSAII